LKRVDGVRQANGGGAWILSIMWSIVTALIYFFVIVPRWRLTSRDVAEVRGAAP
jgi:hypothetical protein